MEYEIIGALLTEYSPFMVLLAFLLYTQTLRDKKADEREVLLLEAHKAMAEEKDKQIAEKNERIESLKREVKELQKQKEECYRNEK